MPRDDDQETTAAGIVFRLDLPHGRCVGVEIRDSQLADVLPDEAAYAQKLGPARQPSFRAGRRALHLALADLGITSGPILPDDRGAPQLPAGVRGSISHKRTRAVALAIRSTAADSIDGEIDDVGIDLEELRALRFDIAPRVLTPAERAQREAVPAADRDRFVLERFSLKESFFKAVNRQVGPHISFQAVEVVAVTQHGWVDLRAPWLTDQGFTVEGWLGCPESGLILSTVRLRSSGFRHPATG